MQQGSPQPQGKRQGGCSSWLFSALLLLPWALLGGCSGDPVSTVPLDGTAAGTRTATPEGQSFSDLEPGRHPRLKHLWASFVLTPEQLQSARRGFVSVQPQALFPCTDCGPSGSPPPTPASRRFVSYRPEQLTFSFQVEPEGSFTRFRGRFGLDTATPLIHPGEGVRLGIQRALLGEAFLEPLPAPQDFHPQQIARGRFQERDWLLPFALPDPETGAALPPLQLELLLTSPIPPTSAPFQRGKPLPPPPGRLYHGVTWSGVPTWEQLLAYGQAVGHPPTWAAAEHRWDPRQDFPQQVASRLRDSGSVPYLRLRLEPDQLSSLAAGEQDETLHAWARGIQRFATPIVLAVGVGEGDPDLQQRAYRHLMQTVRSETNLLWVVELDGQDAEAVSTWARFPEMDWLSLELTGEPSDFEPLYRRLTALNPQVPLVIGGLAFDSEASQFFLEGLEARRWPQVIGWSWSLSGDGIPSQAAQDWQQRLQQGDPSPWLREMRVQPPPAPPASPTP